MTQVAVIAHHKSGLTGAITRILMAQAIDTNRGPTYAEARAMHIAAAATTEKGRVQRPEGNLRGRLDPYRRPWHPELLPRAERIALADYLRDVPGAAEVLTRMPPRRMVTDFRVIPESRQMRRAQDRKEDNQ